MGVTVRLLGPVEVVQDGVRLPVRGRQERAVVARLGLDARRAVSVAEVSAAVWDEPPASAEASVRVLVSRLRKAWLAEGVDVLRTTPSGYSLDAPEVDATSSNRSCNRAEPSYRSATSPCRSHAAAGPRPMARAAVQRCRDGGPVPGSRPIE